ncbi:hypothetical protein pb186bvf_000696 [Paramecium bursaria]
MNTLIIEIQNSIQKFSQNLEEILIFSDREDPYLKMKTELTMCWIFEKIFQNS